MAPPPLQFTPPLLNSACPWATTREHLEGLLKCSSTGAITVRTSLIGGFDHQPDRHRFAFFSPFTPCAGQGDTFSLPDNDAAKAAHGGLDEADGEQDVASLNTLGYSPIKLHEYLDMLGEIANDPKMLECHGKTVIVSVTGDKDSIMSCYNVIMVKQESLAFKLAMEINLSCPNIPGSPPVAYDADALGEYLAVLPERPAFPVGIKTPPYTHAGQYDALLSALKTSNAGSRLSFITSTNTLGSCLILNDTNSPVLPAGGVGGMAGPPLHPLSLGNVSTIRKMLDGDSKLSGIAVIGVGGVSDGQGYKRMRAVGASAVALATALGKQGTQVFNNIQRDIDSDW